MAATVAAIDTWHNNYPDKSFSQKQKKEMDKTHPQTNQSYGLTQRYSTESMQLDLEKFTCDICEKTCSKI